MMMKSVLARLGLLPGLLALLFLCASPSHAQEDDGILSDLKAQNIDFLTFGMQALEDEFRMTHLESCVRNGCANRDFSVNVTHGENRPEWWDQVGVSFPKDGLIILNLNNTRTGQDSSYATEDGCRLSLDHQSKVHFSPRLPWMNRSRYFLPRQDWRDIRVEGSPVVRRLIDISSHVLMVVTEKHEWYKADGALDRSEWVICAAMPYYYEVDAERFPIASIARGQDPR